MSQRPWRRRRSGSARRPGCRCTGTGWPRRRPRTTRWRATQSARCWSTLPLLRRWSGNRLLLLVAGRRVRVFLGDRVCLALGLLPAEHRPLLEELLVLQRVVVRVDVGGRRHVVGVVVGD